MKAWFNPMRSLIPIILLTSATGCGAEQSSETFASPDAHHMESPLQTECREYLEHGPPAHMATYVPESLTEIVIAHGAKGEPLDPELAEIGGIILMESNTIPDIEDPAIRAYMQKGADLVRRVLEANQ